MNDIILLALITMIFAQAIKLPIYYFKKGKWDFKIIFSTGSMPSSHSAVVVATMLEIGILEGYNSSIFGLAFVFMGIVIHDAIKVRGESGKQAVKINQLDEELKNVQEIIKVNNSLEVRQEQLKELIGHTSSEVIIGIITGLVIFMIYNLY